MKQQNENEESNAVSVSVQSDRTFLATEPIGKLLAKLALPTIAAQLINITLLTVSISDIFRIRGRWH